MVSRSEGSSSELVVPNELSLIAKLPDGTTHTEKFEKSIKWSSARLKIAQAFDLRTEAGQSVELRGVVRGHCIDPEETLGTVHDRTGNERDLVVHCLVPFPAPSNEAGQPEHQSATSPPGRSIPRSSVSASSGPSLMSSGNVIVETQMINGSRDGNASLGGVGALLQSLRSTFEGNSREGDELTGGTTSGPTIRRRIIRMNAGNALPDDMPFLAGPDLGIPLHMEVSIEQANNDNTPTIDAPQETTDESDQNDNAPQSSRLPPDMPPELHSIFAAVQNAFGGQNTQVENGPDSTIATFTLSPSDMASLLGSHSTATHSTHPPSSHTSPHSDPTSTVHHPSSNIEQVILPDGRATVIRHVRRSSSDSDRSSNLLPPALRDLVRTIQQAAGPSRSRGGASSVSGPPNRNRIQNRERRASDGNNDCNNESGQHRRVMTGGIQMQLHDAPSLRRLGLDFAIMAPIGGGDRIEGPSESMRDHIRRMATLSSDGGIVLPEAATETPSTTNDSPAPITTRPPSDILSSSNANHDASRTVRSYRPIYRPRFGLVRQRASEPSPMIAHDTNSTNCQPTMSPQRSRPIPPAIPRVERPTNRVTFPLRRGEYSSANHAFLPPGTPVVVDPGVTGAFLSPGPYHRSSSDSTTQDSLAVSTISRVSEPRVLPLASVSHPRGIDNRPSHHRQSNANVFQPSTNEEGATNQRPQNISPNSSRLSSFVNDVFGRSNQRLRAARRIMEQSPYSIPDTAAFLSNLPVTHRAGEATTNRRTEEDELCDFRDLDVIWSLLEMASAYVPSIFIATQAHRESNRNQSIARGTTLVATFLQEVNSLNVLVNQVVSYYNQMLIHRHSAQYQDSARELTFIVSSLHGGMAGLNAQTSLIHYQITSENHQNPSTIVQTIQSGPSNEITSTATRATSQTSMPTSPRTRPPEPFRE